MVPGGRPSSCTIDHLSHRPTVRIGPYHGRIWLAVDTKVRRKSESVSPETRRSFYVDAETIVKRVFVRAEDIMQLLAFRPGQECRDVCELIGSWIKGNEIRTQANLRDDGVRLRQTPESIVEKCREIAGG
jgi:hypothetical protein